MARKAEPGLQQTSSVPQGDAAAEAGFTLIELVCVLAIVALLAAIALPAIPRRTSRQQLESYAVEIASMLHADRSAAVRNRNDVATEIDARARILRSGARRQAIQIPDDVSLTLVSAATCRQRRAQASIVFLASGMSCGGTITLSHAGIGYEVRVNWLTGGVDIVPRNAI
jgi:general secretion pathway protein H